MGSVVDFAVGRGGFEVDEDEDDDDDAGAGEDTIVAD